MVSHFASWFDLVGMIRSATVEHFQESVSMYVALLVVNNAYIERERERARRDSDWCVIQNCSI
jgi:hypothetical protein